MVSIELIPNFASLADSLYCSVHSLKNVCSDELDAAFRALKVAISSESIVQIADPSHAFILQTNESSVAVGAVLLQFFVDANREFPMAFYSRTLLTSERRYLTYGEGNARRSQYHGALQGLPLR